jgi:putative flippase GtrA
MMSAILVSGALAAISFAVNYLWTWRVKNRELKVKVVSRFIKYVMAGGGVTLMSWCLLYALTEFAHLWYMVSLVIVWIVGMTVAFLVNNSWTYSKAK